MPARLTPGAVAVPREYREHIGYARARARHTRTHQSAGVQQRPARLAPGELLQRTGECHG